MTVFYYGCDMRLPGTINVGKPQLKNQRWTIIGYLKEHGLPEFDQSKWHSDIGNAILTPWVVRPGAMKLLIQARKGDTIIVDKPERVVTKILGRGGSGSDRSTFNSLAEVGITIRTTMPEFPVIAPVDSPTWRVMIARYSAAMSLAKYGKTNEAFNVNFPLHPPIGWRVAEKRLIPDRSERVIAINIYNCAINNFLPMRFVAKAFRLPKNEVIKACIAVENQFALLHTIRFQPQAISATGPTEPNARGILRALCGPPLSLRELAFRTGVPALQLHYIFRNMISADRFIQTKGFTTFPVSKMLVPIVLPDPQYVQVTKITLSKEAQTLIAADSPLIDYEAVADSFSTTPSSARIFHELDGAGPPLPCRLSSLSQRETDRLRTHAEPSPPPDQEQDQSDVEEPESL